MIKKIGGLLRGVGRRFDDNASGVLPEALGEDYTPAVRRRARSNAIMSAGAMLASGGRYPMGEGLQQGQLAMLQQMLPEVRARREGQAAQQREMARQTALQETLGGASDMSSPEGLRARASQYEQAHMRTGNKEYLDMAEKLYQRAEALEGQRKPKVVRSEIVEKDGQVGRLQEFENGDVRFDPGVRERPSFEHQDVGGKSVQIDKRTGLPTGREFEKGPTPDAVLGDTRAREQFEEEAPLRRMRAETAAKHADVAARYAALAERAQKEGTGGGLLAGKQADAQAIADAIETGIQPPDLTRMYGLAGPVRAELSRRNYDLVTAQRDWQAVQRHLSTLNGPQQERLFQAVDFTYHSIDIIEGLYQEWLEVGPASGFKGLNKAALAAAKQTPGRAGAVAQALEAQINDLTSELGTVYKGGNSSTDESLRLAAENLKADWNQQQFEKSVGLIKKNLQLRRNSMVNSKPRGASEGSIYVKPGGGAQPSGVPPVGSNFQGGRVRSVTRIE